MATIKKTSAEPAKMTPAQMKKKIESLEAENEKLKNSSRCLVCDTLKKKDDFYVSTDPMNKSGVTPICKLCAKKIALRVDKNGEEHEPSKESCQKSLKLLNKPFINSVWDSSIQESENLVAGKTKSNVWTSYIKNIAMVNWIGLTWDDSDMFKEKIIYEDEQTPETLADSHSGQDTYTDYLKNKKDVIRLLSYDPFEKEAISDQPFLYSQLLGLLDASEDANDDMMRTASAISIVRGFLQQSKIDDTIAKLMTDIQELQRNSATIKSLQDSKKSLTSIIKDLAAESCISLKNNKNAKKGENTWTGKVKKIKDLDLRQGRVNGFDIETSKAMRQVMDNSHHSIMQELKLDDSDWSDMVAEQREMIVKLQDKLDKYIEISRILLSENLDLKDFINDQDINIHGYSYVDLEDLYSCFSAEDDEDERITEDAETETVESEVEANET